MTALGPLLEANAAEAERLRRPVDVVMKAIEDTGAYRWFVPRRFGGYEFSLEGFVKVGMALGEGCLSTAWVTTFCMEHNWLLGLFGREAQEDIFGRQPYIIAPGALAPKGKAVPVEGGYRLSGRWEWGTGVMHADWVMVGGMGPGEHSPAPDLFMYLLPIEQAKVIDTWHIAGMVGTGSNDIEVDDVFVPAHRRASVGAMRAGRSPGAEYLDTPTYRMPMLPVLGLTAAAPAVGCARKAVALFRQRLAEREIYGTASKQAERPVAQVRLARLVTQMGRIERDLLDLAREVTEWGHRPDDCDDLVRAELKLRIGEAVRQARDVVRDVVEASGAHAHFLANPLQRFHRDLHTLSCHTVFDVELGAENYGRLLLGLPPNAPV
jgi:alkylation response protein AidB-like acyl-CoA dehydrogenase